MSDPVESLRRDGKFYLCLVADSSPQGLAAIEDSELRSQDVRKICDDLLDVIKNESGRPTNTFSLNLSSKLLRGVTRLYQKKVDIFLDELSMVKANIEKSTNRNYNIEASTSSPPPQVMEPHAQYLLEDELESEEQVIQMLLNSGNVANIEDITLREDPIPEILLPPNDGFGEENPDELLPPCDCTVEMMLATHDASGRHPPDNSRRALDTQMEGISERDITIFTKSHGEVMFEDFEKEFRIPEIPEIPEIPIPQEQYDIEASTSSPPPQVMEPHAQFLLEDELESEEQVIQMLLNSGNVANIEDITLREDPIPEILLPPNDGFGEKNPEELLPPCDCTVEMMLATHDASGRHPPDNSRRALDTQMEGISERDITIFTKSHGEVMFEDFEKEFRIPEIPEIPIPQEQLPLESEIVEAQTPTVQEPEEIVFEN